MRRRRGWLLLGPIGSAALLYVLLEHGFLHTGTTEVGALAWALLGVLPMFVFSMWLLSATTSRTAVYLALGSTGMAVGAAYETFGGVNPWIVDHGAYPFINQIGLAANVIGTIGFLLMLAAFPDGTVERPWQRHALSLLWLPLVAVPLTLLTSRLVVRAPFVDLPTDVPNPYAVPPLSFASGVVDQLAVGWHLPVAVGIGVFASRLVLGDRRTRRRLHFMTWTLVFAMVAFSVWILAQALGFDEGVLGVAVLAVVFISMVALPVAGIHGVLNEGAFDIEAADRARVVLRSSTMLIDLFYGLAVAAPAVLLLQHLAPFGATILAAVTAVALLPARGWATRAIRRTVFGDRDRQLAMLRTIGARLEQTAEPDEPLAHVAGTIRAGLDANWVRLTVQAPAGRELTSLAGDPDEEAALSRDLVDGTATIGRLEVGRRRHGDYSQAERGLVATVSGHVTSLVVKRQLADRLADQLAELTASRERLVGVQDEERRRIERDLHDGVQQNVIALIAGLRLARNRLGRSELNATDLVELQEQAREMLADLRELVHGIHPPVLTDNGLVAAVESGIVRYPIRLTVEADDCVRTARLPTDVEATAYFVVREALANTAKHAEARSAQVTLCRVNGQLHIEVSDDGHGFEPGVSPASGGLANIRDRVGATRGHMSLSANSPSGTRLTVDLPIPSGDHHG